MAGTEKDFVNGTTPTCAAEDLNGFKLENNNLIESVGMTLDDEDHDQTGEAVSAYSSVGNFYTGSGSANTYSANPVGDYYGIPSLINGAQVRFVVPATNTGASTLNVNGLGAKNIKRWDGSALVAGDLAINEIVSVIYNLANTEWRLALTLQQHMIKYLEDLSMTMANKIFTLPLLNGEKKSYSTKSSDYTINDTDNLSVIYVDDTSSDRTIYLPTASDNINRIITIKNISSDKGKVTIDGEGSETIDGQLTIILDAKYSYVKVQSDGTEWHILDWDIPEKQYTLTIGGTNVTGTVRAVGIPYRNDIRDTIWRIKYNIVFNTSSASRSTQGFTIDGIVYKSTTNFYQRAIGNTTSSASAYTTACTLNENANSGSIVHATATTTEYGVSADVELNAKPSFVE